MVVTSAAAAAAHAVSGRGTQSVRPTDQDSAVVGLVTLL